MQRSSTKAELNSSVWDRLYQRSHDRAKLLKTGDSGANKERFKRTTLWDPEPEKAPTARPQTATTTPAGTVTTPSKVTTCRRATFGQHNQSKVPLAYEENKREKTPPRQVVSSPIKHDDAGTPEKAFGKINTRIKTFAQKYSSGFSLGDSQKPDEGVNTRIKTYQGKKNASQFALEHKGAPAEALPQRASPAKARDNRDFIGSASTLPGSRAPKVEEKPLSTYVSHSQYTAAKAGFDMPSKPATVADMPVEKAGAAGAKEGAASKRLSKGVDQEKRTMIFGSGEKQERRLTESRGKCPEGVRNQFASSIIF